MAVTHGMDVVEVRRLGGSLQSIAVSVDDLIKELEGAVGVSAWVGPDATAFKTQWWPVKRASLVLVREELRGLGQTALDNADQQDQASNADGRGAPTAEGYFGAVHRDTRPSTECTPENLDVHRAAAIKWAADNPGDVAELIMANLGGEPPKQLLYFDPARGHIAWVSGDLESATEVVFVVPGTGVDMAKASGNFTAEAAGYQNGRDNVAVVSALTWQPPSNPLDNLNIGTDEALSVNGGPTGDLLVSLGESGKQITLVGHSAGATAVQRLYLDNPGIREHVDAVALLAAPDLDGRFAEAMGTKPYVAAYHHEDDINTWASAHGQKDNWPGGHITYESAELGVFETIIEKGPGVELFLHPAHEHSRYVTHFADDVDALLSSP